MNYSDFIYDFNLYLCERFGYRNCCSVMHNANGICVSVHVGEMDLYIRFWEYSCGVGSIPDWSIIIVRGNFKRNQQENLKDLARFFKEYAPRYGYKYLCTEDDDYKYYQTLGLKLIHRGFFRQYNYGLPLIERESTVVLRYYSVRIFINNIQQSKEQTTSFGTYSPYMFSLLTVPPY